MTPCATDITSTPFISQYTFRCLAQHGLLPDCNVKHHHSGIPNGVTPTHVSHGDIIYVNLDLIESFFSLTDPLIKARYVLITGLTDTPLDDRTATLISNNVLHWYTQNNTSTHPKVSTIPIGLQNRYWRGPDDYQGDVALLREIRTEPIEPSEPILVSFTVSSNPSERIRCRDYFATRHKLVTFRAFDFSRRGERPVVTEHFRAIRSHKFVVCPFGRGFDCFRTWETFSLGSIPIIKKHKSMQEFYDMPAWFVDDWTDVTEYSMDQKYDEMKRKWETYNHEKTFITYWRRLILAPN